MKIIDTHAHIYPERIAEKATEAISEFYEIRMQTNGHLATLFERGAQAGIVGHIVSSAATAPAQTMSINRFLSEAGKTYADKLFAFGTFHPMDADKGAVFSGFREMGLHGAKIHPDFQKVPVDDPGYCEGYEILQELGLPVLCHTGDNRYDFSNPGRVEHVLKMFPRLRFIAAHLGGWTVWREATEKLAPYDNVVVDCSSSLFAMSPEEAADLIRGYGADRVFFGTDFPMWDPVEEVDRVNRLPITETEREKIFALNALNYFGSELPESWRK
ncbi:MAG: amidohydrolase family protein [Clostridia bacterium]|nr:amidohydrolase family protein [Clostridia bacterium]